MKFPVFSSADGFPVEGRNLYISAILAIFLFKIALVIAWGPGMAPDTFGYTEFADLIFEGSGWLTNAELDSGAMPTTVFRIMGYPFIIAGAQLIAAEYWQWVVILLQYLLTAFSLISLARLISELGLRPLVGAFCLLSSGLSFSLLLDNMILTDSLAASVFIIVLSENAIASLREKPFGYVQALISGVLIALAFLVREGVAILSILFVVPFLVRAFLAKEKRWHSCAAIAAFFVPLLLTTQIYKAWNENRTGYSFVTTGAQTVYLSGLVDAAEKDQKIFSGDEAIDVTAREKLKNYSFSEVLAIQGSLFAQGYVAPELASLSKRKYFESWVEFPSSMLRMTIGHVTEKYATMAFRPIGTVREAGLWVNGEKPWPDYRELRKSMFEDVGAFALVVGEMVERVIAISITISFVIVPLIWLVRLCLGKKPEKREVLVCFALWAVYFGVLFAHALVHLETRYLTPVVPFSIVIGCLGIQRVLYRKKYSESKT